ncbi:MAG TPA: 3-oxoacid CoA-transferase subunit B [Dehalococcoidia bacterium]|nr:3-oxoacid CoA-transferase subunit B [Dehalococcoidia bacterium]
MAGERLDEQAMALRAVKEFRDGMVVNLGVGIPTLCSLYVPPDLDVIFHSENGIIGFGPVVTDPAEADVDLVNASIQPVKPRPGMAIVDHAESFAIIRGGRIDITVLGAVQVSERGDLANHQLPGKALGSLGGGMDLAFNAKRVIVVMTHTTKDGQPKIVRELTQPLTAPRCVSLIITDIAVVEVTPQGLLLRELVPGWTPEEVQALTAAPLKVAQDLKVMELL